METQQLLVRLPEDLVRRFRRAVPARSRSAYVQRLLEQTLPDDPEDAELVAAALALEADDVVNAEMAEWDGTLADGLDDPA